MSIGTIYKKFKKHILRKRCFKLINGKLAGKLDAKSINKKRNLMIKAGFKIGDNTKIIGPLYVSANLEVGNNSWLGKNFEAQGNGTIRIGNDCSIAPNVIISTGNHDIGSSQHRAGRPYNSNISIGNGTWVCVNSTIVNDCTIGQGCVIAAGSVVTKSCPDNCLIGGVPAKVIKKLI